MRTIQREIVGALIFSKEGKLLQALQTPNGGGVYPGHWALFGGGVEEGEDYRTALNREIMEESGIDISGYAVELIDEAHGEAEKTLKATGERVLVQMNFHTYSVTIGDKNALEIPVVLDDEHTEYKWSELSELKELKITPPSVDLFKRLGYL